MTTKEVSEILKIVSSNEVASMCRSGEIYGVYNDGWDIPPESIIMYAQYNPVYQKRVNEKVSIMKPDITNETYTVSQLADIFSTDVKTIRKWIREDKFPCTKFHRFRPILKGTTIPAVSVVLFLYGQASKGELEKLQDRQVKLMATNDPLEPMIRHLLMLYTYYKSNGYLV